MSNNNANTLCTTHTYNSYHIVADYSWNSPAILRCVFYSHSVQLSYSMHKGMRSFISQFCLCHYNSIACVCVCFFPECWFVVVVALCWDWIILSLDFVLHFGKKCSSWSLSRELVSFADTCEYSIYATTYQHQKQQERERETESERCRKRNVIKYMQVIRNVVATHKYTIRLVLSRPAHVRIFVTIRLLLLVFFRAGSLFLTIQRMQDENVRKISSVFRNYFIYKRTLLAWNILSTDCAIWVVWIRAFRATFVVDFFAPRSFGIFVYVANCEYVAYAMICFARPSLVRHFFFYPTINLHNRYADLFASEAPFASKEH